MLARHFLKFIPKATPKKHLPIQKPTLWKLKPTKNQKLKRNVSVFLKLNGKIFPNETTYNYSSDVKSLQK
jgi:hypothetical protein